LSVRLKLTLSYAGFLMVARALLIGVVWVLLVRYLPDVAVIPGGMLIRSDLLRTFALAVAYALAFLLVFGLLGGWILAGRMLAPLTRITEATRMAATGSLAHRIEMEGREDEFRELADAFDAMLARLEAHVAEQQRFAANASHELRTPLAITQTLLDVASNDPNATPANSSTAWTPSTSGRSTSPKHCSCTAAPTSGPSPENTSTCPWQLKKPSKRFSPSRKSTPSASRSPGRSLPPSAHTRSCCC
jgi:signal transduction histidine kinase